MTLFSVAIILIFALLFLFASDYRVISRARLHLSKDPLDILALAVYENLSKDGWTIAESYAFNCIIRRNDVRVDFNNINVTRVIVKQSSYYMNSYANRVLWLRANKIKEAIIEEEGSRVMAEARKRAYSAIEHVKSEES